MTNQKEKVEEVQTEINSLNLSRQSKLIPQDIIEATTFKVFGVGSVGSHVVETLAKAGAKLIEVYDRDIVEEENIAAQAYGFKHINMNKVEALKQLVLDGSGVEIVTHHGDITEETDIIPEPNTIYMCFFDSLGARKLVFDKVKDYPVIFVDGRIGKYHMRHYLVDLTNPIQKETYAESLEVKAMTELVCGEKASAPINKIIAGKIVMNVVNFLSGKTYEKVFIGSAEMPKTDIIILEQREQPEPITEPLEEEIENEE